MNPADQIEAVVARAVRTLRAVEQQHRTQREIAATGWRDPIDQEADGSTTEDETDDARRPVLGPAEIAALSDAAGG